MPPYQYKPLHKAFRQVRLLKILPDSWTAHLIRNPFQRCEPIKCTLQQESLIMSPTYTALSYSWETDKLTESICIDGDFFMIPKNLHAALSHLRAQKFTGMLWVDAICIQQDNDAEKAWQIAQMREIYASAKKVIVWLGPASSDSDLALEKLRRAGTMALVSGVPIATERDSTKWTSMIRASRRANDEATAFVQPVSIGTSLHTFLLEAILSLLRRSWWARLWVVEEVALAQDVDFMCGALSLPAKEVFYGLNIFELKRASIMWKVQSGQPLSE